MKTTRDQCHNLLMEIMNRLEREQPHSADKVWELFRDRFEDDPSISFKRAAEMLVSRLTGYEATRLHALMGAPPLE